MKTQIIVPPLNSNCPTLKLYEEAKNLITTYQQAVTEQTENTTLVCPHCHHEQQIKTSTFVKDYYYETPYGASGGDKYHEMDTSLYVCNKCSQTPQLAESLKSQSELFNIIKYRRDNILHDRYC